MAYNGREGFNNYIFYCLYGYSLVLYQDRMRRNKDVLTVWSFVSYGGAGGRESGGNGLRGTQQKGGGGFWIFLYGS